MALPPDPIEEVLPTADAAVLAHVTRVLVKEPSPAPMKAEPGATSLPTQAPRQVVELQVDEVLFGNAKPGELLKVVKPAGAYALSQGNHGPFLLKQEEILGRYGPDTYTRRYIEDTAKKLGKK